MRLLLLINLTAVAVAGVAMAQTEEPPMSLPPVSVDPQRNNLPPALDLGPQQGSGNNSAARGNSGNAGNAKGGYDDLNKRLMGEVNKVNPPITNQPPLDARSPDTRIGVINIPGVRQQYGQNFGISAQPYRPPPLVYSAPLGRH
jgi:hypothetical protein|nr:hypothetical protein [Bradyrhizobium elkanii]